MNRKLLDLVLLLIFYFGTLKLAIQPADKNLKLLSRLLMRAILSADSHLLQ